MKQEHITYIDNKIDKTQSIEPSTITITVPVTFLGDLHSELPDGVIRDVIGYLYYEQSFPPELMAEIQALGFDPGQFLIHN